MAMAWSLLAEVAPGGGCCSGWIDMSALELVGVAIATDKVNLLCAGENNAIAMLKYPA
jgi:hypothetical protein